jgi:hypothetical protein
MRNLFRGALMGALMVLLFSCQDEIISPVEKKSNASGKVPGQINNSNARLDTNPLAWDTGEANWEWMPTPAGYQVPTPWFSGAAGVGYEDLMGDYHKADGWVLLYNSFSTAIFPDHPYFMLYNKYRGLIRFYYFVPANTNYINSQKIIHSLYALGSHKTASPMLNFADQEFVDVAKNSLFASRMEAQSVGRAAWNVLEYELAFDKNVVNQNYSSFYFNWPVRGQQITTLSLTGTQTGTINGLIAAPIKKEGFDFVINGTGNLAGETVKLVFKGESDAEKFGGLVKNAIKGIMADGASGLVRNVLGGIFGGSPSPGIQKINMEMNTKITLTGTQLSDFNVAAINLAMPGYNQTQTPGYSPSYNSPLGVFYISAKPTIKVKRTVIRDEPNPLDKPAFYRNTFTLDASSFQMIYNPAVVGGTIGGITYPAIATIQNVKNEILLMNPNNEPSMWNINGVPETLYNANPIVSSISSFNTYIGGNTGVVRLRISFDVVPTDGSPKTRISKTFMVNSIME